MLKNATSATLPLFKAYPGLAERVPRISIGRWPTPVIEATRFARAHKLRALYVKREDLGHDQCGGNKVRGLEFLLAEAERRGARILVTISSAGSHHISKTAWHARTLGIDTIALVLRQPPAAYVRRNLLVGMAAKTTYVPANFLTAGPKLAWLLARGWGRRTAGPSMFIPPGGTSPLSMLGHVNAAFELKRQIDEGLLPEPDYLYAAMGSLGTVAGLSVGCKLAGLRTRIVGVTVSYRWYCTRGRWARFARRALRLMQESDPSVPNITVHREELTVVHAALGPGYACVTPSATRLARAFFDSEGIELDGTYTAKTLDGALQFIRRRRLEGRVHLFWHTYDSPEAPADVGVGPLPKRLQHYVSNNATQ